MNYRIEVEHNGRRYVGAEFDGKDLEALLKFLEGISEFKYFRLEGAMGEHYIFPGEVLRQSIVTVRPVEASDG